jgi:hypothetical protein
MTRVNEIKAYLAIAQANTGYLQKIGKKYNSLIIKTLQPL